MIEHQERLLIIVELIAHDLKIHKHLHFLEKSGLDTSFLQLHLHDKIFKLAGIDETQIDDPLHEWYYQMAEKAFEIDVFRDELKLLEIATEILVALNKKQYNKI
jgi:hypothetical protein